MQNRSIVQACLHARGYASVAAVPSGAIKIDPEVFNRQSVKPAGSRKSILHADYVDYYRRHRTMLLLQHNNLTQADLLKLRTEFKALGARIRIVRVGIFQHAVRVAEVTKADEALQQLDVNSKQVYKLTKRLGRERLGVGLRLTDLLSGPICAITFNPSPQQASTATETREETVSNDAVEPEALQKVLSLVKSTNNKMLLLGGKFEDTVFAVDALERVSQLPALPILQGQLLSLLGASAQRLVALLGSPAQRLAATVDGRRVQLEEEGSDGSSKSA
ncbi:hypothetical protein BCR37DRAFT_45887 [Protomyces lactucae-debilis]|uniref:Ribosomal protein L10-domain-containing protein n=1 Tax=Protomyces lactucae-debilis TaxID=2754530 RepID=A0A1Y2FDR8_PROLT|nr:uncharacterized protein BCR37DRAFT_45887 [Protomyces lactucae-debilis]ORY81466.1 hypothetical protein BCR37DRAFT_45887 [Protomyces lactucae-debilis]